jgi:hypothetical protein
MSDTLPAPTLFVTSVDYSVRHKYHTIIVVTIMADPSTGEVQHLHEYSEEQTKVLDALEAEALRLFPPSPNQHYDRHDLKLQVEQWSHTKGAHTSFHGNCFECKRAVEPRSYASIL